MSGGRSSSTAQTTRCGDRYEWLGEKRRAEKQRRRGLFKTAPLCFNRHMPSLKEILFKLLRFKSETRNQPEVYAALRYIASLFQGTRYVTKEFKKEGVCSLLVYPKGSNLKRPRILLSGHVDVVPAKEAIQYKP